MAWPDAQIRPDSRVAPHGGNGRSCCASHPRGNRRAGEGEIRTLLAAWRDNDAKLRPLLEQSSLLHELVPLSEYLATLGVAGSFALDHLGKSAPSPESWRAQQLALLERAKTPEADLLLIVVVP